MLSKLLANTPRRRIAILTAATILSLAGQMSSAAQKGPGTRRVYSKAFAIRVHEYMALQRKLEAGLPPLTPTDEPTRVEVHSRGLADRLREARQTAKPGDIFGDTADDIRQVVREDSERRAARDAYAAMAEVPIQAPSGLNADYPEKMPLATVPPLILARLPELPEGLEYRFMGRDLILRDVKANIIVDIVHEAIPTIAK
jgi:hypothetical protein